MIIWIMIDLHPKLKFPTNGRICPALRSAGTVHWCVCMCVCMRSHRPALTALPCVSVISSTCIQITGSLLSVGKECVFNQITLPLMHSPNPPPFLSLFLSPFVNSVDVEGIIHLSLEVSVTTSPSMPVKYHQQWLCSKINPAKYKQALHNKSLLCLLFTLFYSVKW